MESCSIENFPYLLCFLQNSLVVGTGNFLAAAGNCNSLLRLRSENCLAIQCGGGFHFGPLLISKP